MPIIIVRQPNRKSNHHGIVYPPISITNNPYIPKGIEIALMNNSQSGPVSEIHLYKLYVPIISAIIDIINSNIFPSSYLPLITDAGWGSFHCIRHHHRWILLETLKARIDLMLYMLIL